jgi:hypothetical protein
LVERRRFSRLRTLLKGSAVSTPDHTADCTVRNLSEAGAQVSAPFQSPLPDAFHLMAPRTRSGHAAEVVWRDGSKCGLAFTQSYELDDPEPLELTVRREWARLNGG